MSRSSATSIPTFRSTLREAPFEGATVAGHIVLFPTDISQAPGSLRYEVSDEVTRHLITGLEPGASYAVEIEQSAGGTLVVSIVPGGTDVADDGGVLDLWT